MSMSWAVGFKMVDGQDPLSRNSREFIEAAGLWRVNKDRALVKMEMLANAGFPPAIESLRLMLVGAARVNQRQFQIGLKSIDAAMKLNNDMPYGFMWRAIAYNGLNRHRKALDAAEKYKQALGIDAAYYGEFGRAQSGLGATNQALAAHRKGLVDDPQSVVNLLGLLRNLPGDRKKTIFHHYRKMNDREAKFEQMGRELVGSKDPQSLRALIDIHRRFHPKDTALAFYKTVLEKFLRKRKP